MADWYVSSAAWTAIAQFAVSGVYTVGQIVRPLTAPAFTAQMAFRCTTAGTAGAEPSWAGTNGNNQTVTTGGATFTNVTGQGTYGWAAAAGNLYEITFVPSSARLAPGDRVFISSDHSETGAGFSYGLNNGGPAFGNISVISVNRAGSVPPVAADVLSGAAIANSSGGITLEPYTNSYWQGITFTLGGTTSQLQLANGGTKSHYFKNCAFVFSTSTTTAFIGCSGPTKATFDNTTVTFNAAGQRLYNGSGYSLDLIWINTPAAVLGTVPTTLFQSAGGNGTLLATCRGVDLSAVTTTLAYSANSISFAKVLLDSCRIASGVVRLGTTAYNSADDEVELVNCFDGTNIISERHTPAGDVTTEKSTTLIGGAADDIGLYSHRMISSSRSDPWTMTLDSFWLDVENTTIGASHVATVELIASAALNNNDVRLMLEYQGTSGSSLATFGDSIASVLTPTAALPTSPQPWNNPPSTPVAQRLSVTFTQNQAGRLRARVRLGKPSTTLWINPQIALTA